MKILERKYQPSRGGVYLDDTDATSVSLASYRANVTVVPETVKIFNGSIADNILLGRVQADTESLERLVEYLGLGPFLSRFPFGLSTLVGEEGRQLSSGERQVIAILRAMVSRPAVLVIDEGLNAVDTQLRLSITRSLIEYARDHAVLIISHNPVTAALAQYAYVLQDGRITAEGTRLDVGGSEEIGVRSNELLHVAVR